MADLRVRVAIEVLGFHVERIKPAWYYGQEVLLFFRKGSPLVEYSWDENSCNAIMHRNGIDDTEGNAPSLPFYEDDANQSLDVVDALVDRGFHVSITTHPRIGEAKSWEVSCTNYTTGVEVVGFGDTMPEAICESALLAVNAAPVEPNIFAPSDTPKP